MSTTDEKRSSLTSSDWEAIADSEKFRTLMKKKKRFIWTATIFFVLYYFALPFLTGYFKFLNTKLIGSINGAYLFALSQFFMAWILAILYVRHANKTDRLVQEIIEEQRRVAQ
ncbi:DUF485 domain-containing protein [Thermoflavimicrobium dichotomicum]|uniref:Uncharacterized membrane protein, DUF485 family n=1 Tax=Thermoflavimicrobium dichotomicum TaxID=46223 RepID=A0A1I3RZZ3_9BACL|nr:DUF485 domain-containing protein [Thermoflavimicrobium dichotomicum]SFJ52163.1 Uncharacterized membrane protein, DUF485 family [Thermoflavimicrobium dichotomicum]